MTDVDRDEQIRRRAYWIWEEEGCPAGEDLRHWSMAEAEFEASKKGSSGDAATTEVPTVEISTGDEPARKKIKSTEGP
ncbi:DUF2934 domain-containing protein [Shinella zoogloeoides]|uniref:DUF2934 domain-containing protein n=1 Tax=Shinella zoogloeoides TaxID=352475 RepID=UPI0027400DB8|nr:DUF2934 domain-containing protein [Shinella zoogloeoides]WLR91303.1 DUF2934 domain-containing protein [Shinella zoogloeoides]